MVAERGQTMNEKEPVYTRQQLIAAARAARVALRSFEAMLIEDGRLPSDDAQFRQTIDGIEGWIGRLAADTAEHSSPADWRWPPRQ